MAVSTKVKDIKIVLQNGYELTVLTEKKPNQKILDENNIVLEENQKTIPELTEEAKAGDIIKIVDKSYTEVQIATISEEGVKRNNFRRIIKQLCTYYGKNCNRTSRNTISNYY